MSVINTFEEQYISARRKENRLYSDDEVLRLPGIDPAHPHREEWLVRKTSANRVGRYLREEKRALDILEIGCGNGWLCAQLSKIPVSRVTGIDINNTELLQAKRVFGHIPNLEFKNTSLEKANFSGAQFDVIVFAASIQYFRDLDKIFRNSFDVLKENGEIHIIDSFFYHSSKLQGARERSEAYYNSLQQPGMSDHYFHHSVDELDTYQHRVLYNPNLFVNRILKKSNPFHWICVYQHA